MASGNFNIPIKYYDTGYIKLNSLTWTATTGGVYAANINISAISGVIIGVTIHSISRIRTSDHIIPYIAGNNSVSLMANTNSFQTAGNGAQMGFRIIYI